MRSATVSEPVARPVQTELARCETPLIARSCQPANASVSAAGQAPSACSSISSTRSALVIVHSPRQSIATDQDRFGKVARQGRIPATHPLRAISIDAAGEASEVRKAAARRGAFTGRLRSIVASPLRGQTTGLPRLALLGSAAADGKRCALRATSQTLGKHQCALPAEVFVFRAEGRVRRESWFELGVVDRFAVALHPQSEMGRRRRESE